jgi:hypothetical protein
MDALEFTAYEAWTDGVRFQLAVQSQFAYPCVPTYPSFLPSPRDFGNIFDNIMAVSGPPSGDLKESSSDDETSSADDNDLSSVEDNSYDILSAEGSDGDTSSADDNDLSSVEDNSDDISSVERNDDEPASDNITTLRPNNERPNFSLDLIKDSTIASVLPSFLAQMQAANQELEEEKAAGTLADRHIELDESDSAIEGEQYIEMNLGLGVLEEKNDGASTTSEGDSSNEEGDVNVMEKLLGGKRKRGVEDEDEGAPKKAKIQEV